jgi:tRNA1(Val) A37 N6-methylase TrmN6
VSVERFLNGRVIARQPEKGFRAGLDAVMLAAAVPDGANALELGAGSGAASLCLAARQPGMAITGLEIEPDLVRLANDNAAANEMQDRVRFVRADIFDPPAALRRDYDCVLTNPPFHGEGRVSPQPERARAKMDRGALSGWLAAGLKRTASGGTLTAIVKADRLAEALAALPPTGICVLPLWPKKDAAAKRVLIQVRKGSKAPCCLLPGRILHKDSGAYTGEADAILRGETALALGVPRL